jgi:hypothetical protein
MNGKAAGGTAVGIASVGSAVGLTGLIKWMVVLMGWPVMPEEAALGLATILTIIGLGVAKLFNVLVERLGRRTQWSAEMRAQVNNQEVK